MIFSYPIQQDKYNDPENKPLTCNWDPIHDKEEDR